MSAVATSSHLQTEAAWGWLQPRLQEELEQARFAGERVSPETRRHLASRERYSVNQPRMALGQ